MNMLFDHSNYKKCLKEIAYSLPYVGTYRILYVEILFHYLCTVSRQKF